MTQEFASNITSDSLHNQNCYAYLTVITPLIPPFISQKFSTAILEGLKQLQFSTYDAKFAYADLYKQLFLELEEKIKDIWDEPRPQQEKTALVDFILSIYNNDNNILCQTFSTIKELVQNRRLGDPKLAIMIHKALRGQDKVNHFSPTPTQAGSNYYRLKSLFGDLKPQSETNLPTIRKYQYKYERNINQLKFGYPEELRFSTQAQRHHGEVRISPLFEHWLKAKQYRHEQQGKKDPIAHIYINNLGFDREDFEGKKERTLSVALHKLEENHPNLALITLPADKGLMARSAIAKIKEKYSYQETYEKFLNLAKRNGNSHAREIKDFYISDKIRARLFVDEEGHYSEAVEEAELKTLLAASFSTLGVQGKTINGAERQAVWVHFTKFSLTNYLIEKLNIESINFSCKDGIDRGGVSSAYYNLLKSFTTETPLTRDNFDEALHAAPSMVKGRGMNGQIKLLWNAVDTYINANYQTLKADPRKSWLIEWRDANCPHRLTGLLLKQRLSQSVNELEQAKKTHPLKIEAIETSLNLLTQIAGTANLCTRKRLLLEAIILTPKIIFEPNKKTIILYKQIADQFKERNPLLKNVVSLMKNLIGLVYKPWAITTPDQYFFNNISHMMLKNCYAEDPNTEEAAANNSVALRTS